VASYGFFELLDSNIGLVALVILPAAADEVEIGATSALAAHDDESSSAASAPQQSFEVVIVYTSAGSAAAVESEHALYPLEQFR
jgi:hypothetical protein